MSGWFLLFISLSQVSISQTANGWLQTETRLTRQIASSDFEQKRSALFEIRNLRSEQASRLALPALKDFDEMVRATAVTSVTFLPKAKAVNAIAPLLDDRSAFVRREAAYALGTVGSANASLPLLRLLQKEKIYEVRTAVVSALGSTGDPNAVVLLIAVLKQRPKDDEDFLRRSAARSIGQIAQVIQTENLYLVTPRNFLSDKYKDTASYKVEQLTAQYPVFVQGIAELARVLVDKKESDDTRREAAFALGAIGDKSAVVVLESNLNNTDYYLAEICKEALLKIKKVE